MNSNPAPNAAAARPSATPPATGATARLLRYDMTLQVLRPLAWPHFAGSTLRGAFGRALRQAACVTGQAHCQGCPLRQQCAYGVVFEPAAPAQPLHPSFRDGIPRYVVQAPGLGAAALQSGQTLDWSLLLLPGAQPFTGLIEHTLRHGLGGHLLQAGHLHTQRIRPTPLDWPMGTSTTSPGATPEPPRQNAGNKGTTAWQLHLISPLRLQRNGQPLRSGSELDTPGLVRAALRRQLQICQLARCTPPDPAPALAAATQCSIDTRQLRWHDMRRHSDRQDRHVPLGGLIGTLTLQGPPRAMATLQPLMALAQQVHLGKETIVGLGRLRGVPDKGPPTHTGLSAKVPPQVP